VRELLEWKGKTDDTTVPSRVKLRVFERHGGICHISGRRIRAGEAWDLDHIVSLINGGEHRESNLAPALIGPHKTKTKADVAEKSQMYHKKKKAYGIRSKRRTIGGRKFDGTPVFPKWRD
jgi:5-methylcytosine-specific restriction enzyme A